MVAPSRERGSKPHRPATSPPCRRVAPSRERGSKLYPSLCEGRSLQVAPSRERGSKPWRCGAAAHRVWSLPRGSVDRNPDMPATFRQRGVAPSRERGSKPRLIPTDGKDGPSLPRGSVDRNSSHGIGWISTVASLPRGSVDRNPRASPATRAGPGRSLAGAWIETVQSQNGSAWQKGRSLAGAWIETGRGGARCAVVGGRSLAGAWIETALSPWPAPPASVAPSREGGSKPRAVQILARKGVAPSRERGSKPSTSGDRWWRAKGRSLAGAWIETPPSPTGTITV